jgi:hypothetical protein
MTCDQLIALLSSQPADRTVLVDGYEGGYDDINSTGEPEVVAVADGAEPCFDEAYVDAEDSELPNAPTQTVILLSRRGRRRAHA